MFGALLLFEYEVYHIVAIAFTAVIFTELVMVLVVMKTWHWVTLLAELLSIACYLIAMLIFPDYFGEFPSPSPPLCTCTLIHISNVPSICT